MIAEKLEQFDGISFVQCVDDYDPRRVGRIASTRLQNQRIELLSERGGEESRIGSDGKSDFFTNERISGKVACDSCYEHPGIIPIHALAAEEECGGETLIVATAASKGVSDRALSGPTYPSQNEGFGMITSFGGLDPQL